jgi:hypothetical protein
MFYIHSSTCISPQLTFSKIDLEQLKEVVNNKLQVIEPVYEGIPPGMLRRMGRATRLGVGAAIPLLRLSDADGIIIGTANGGMEDCIKFLNQIVDYKEGLLTPGNFVQSTPNGIAATAGLLTANKGYNITHVHSGVSFENAMLDAAMMLKEFPGSCYIVGGVDEISTYNYNIEDLAGWYKDHTVTSENFYLSGTPGSVAGEGAVMFRVNNARDNAVACFNAVHFLHTENVEEMQGSLSEFLQLHAAECDIDLLITGENGDHRLQKWYAACEALLSAETTIARFKHMSGEYATASAMALWLGCRLLRNSHLPPHMVKRASGKNSFRKILIYNTYKGVQHSFMLISTP